MTGGPGCEPDGRGDVCSSEGALVALSAALNALDLDADRLWEVAFFFSRLYIFRDVCCSEGALVALSAALNALDLDADRLWEVAFFLDMCLYH